MRACKRPSQARVQVSDHNESESEEGLSSDWDPATERACKRAARINTAQGENDNTRAEVGSSPSRSTAQQQQQQQQQQQGQNLQVIRKHFTNVCAVIKSRAGRGVDLCLPQDIQTVFPQLPVIVSVSFVVDGQAIGNQPAELPVTQGGTVHGYDGHPVSASGRFCKLLLKESCGVHQYLNHLVTGYTAESATNTSPPKLTIHLKSPAVQQAEAAALRTEEEETGWIIYKYKAHRSVRPRSLSSTCNQVKLSQNLLDRAYPGVHHKGMNLQVTIIKNNMRVMGVHSSSTLTYHTQPNGSTKPVLLVSACAAQALAGCCIQCLKAKPPNIFQVIAVSAFNSIQLQQTLCNTTPATNHPATSAATPPPMATAAQAQVQAPPPAQAPSTPPPPGAPVTPGAAPGAIALAPTSRSAAAQTQVHVAAAAPSSLLPALAPALGSSGGVVPPPPAPEAAPPASSEAVQAQMQATPLVAPSPEAPAGAAPGAIVPPGSSQAAQGQVQVAQAPIVPPASLPRGATKPPPAPLGAAQAQVQVASATPAAPTPAAPPAQARAPPVAALPGASQAQVEAAVTTAVLPIKMEAPVIVIDSDEDDAEQPVSTYTLTDCDDDILVAGRQLTRLLRQLQAPDEQVVQLNACIKQLCGDHADQGRLKFFWYDYEQLQLWVERRNAAQCKSALQQLLCNASS